MVDLTGIRSGFIFAVVSVAIFAALVSFGVSEIPTAFSDSTSIEYFEAPEYFSAEDVEDLATFYNITADNAGAYYSEAWGIDEGFGHHFLYQVSTVGGEFQMSNEHYFVYYVIVEIPYGNHEMEFIEKDTGINRGGKLTDSEFEEADVWDADTGISSVDYYLRCDHVSMHAVVAYNGTAYANATVAFANDALTIAFGIDWDELGTGINAYQLISQLMTFQRPDIHPLLNTFIAVPLWAMVGFIIVVIILAIIEVLPFT